MKILIISFLLFLTTNIWAELLGQANEWGCLVDDFPEEMKEVKYLSCKGKNTEDWNGLGSVNKDFTLKITTLLENHRDFYAEEYRIKSETSCTHSRASVNIRFINLPVLLIGGLGGKDCIYGEESYSCNRHEERVIKDKTDWLNFNVNRKSGVYSFFGWSNSAIYGKHEGQCEVSSSKNKF